MQFKEKSKQVIKISRIFQMKSKEKTNVWIKSESNVQAKNM